LKRGVVIVLIVTDMEAVSKGVQHVRVSLEAGIRSPGSPCPLPSISAARLLNQILTSILPRLNKDITLP
jgi:hypothetical protein